MLLAETEPKSLPFSPARAFKVKISLERLDDNSVAALSSHISRFNRRAFNTSSCLLLAAVAGIASPCGIK